MCYSPSFSASSSDIPTAEEAQKSIKGMEENAIHAKYFELVRNLVYVNSHIFIEVQLSLQSSNVPSEIMQKRNKN